MVTEKERDHLSCRWLGHLSQERAHRLRPSMDKPLGSIEECDPGQHLSVWREARYSNFMSHGLSKNKTKSNRSFLKRKSRVSLLTMNGRHMLSVLLEVE